MTEIQPEIHIQEPAKFTWGPNDIVWDDEEPAPPAATRPLNPRDHTGKFSDHGKGQATSLGEEA